MVPGAGLEPARLLQARDFKSLVSTIPPPRHIKLKIFYKMDAVGRI